MEILIESFQYGIVPTLIVLIAFLITKYLDNKKEREIAKKSIKVNADLLDCFNNLNEYLRKITKDIIDKEDDRCAAAIRSSFKAMAHSVSKFAIFTIISNNVKTNRQNIIDNIQNTVYSEFANIYNELLLYSFDDHNIADYLQEDWKDQIVSDLKTIIFDEDNTKESRIYNVHNKINLRVSNYISYVNKKFLENDKSK
jgi:hypothetical protein